MTAPSPEIAHLDWDGIRCQCGNHGTTGCRDTATHQVEVHAVNKCRTAGTNPDGNVVEVLCDRCLGDLRGRIRFAVEVFKANGHIRCRTCSFPTTHTDHLLRKVSPL